MAQVTCECPMAASGYRRVHAATCPNYRQHKGPQPHDYTGRARVPRTYAHARQAVERLRELLYKMMDDGYLKQYVVADCRTQVEEVRRYLDGE